MAALNLVAWTPGGVSAVALHRRDGSVRAFAWVDDDDFARVAERGWQLNRAGYASARVPGNRWTRLHRFVLGLRNPKLDADHINRNRLDCRRVNLRVVTRQQNRQNTSGWLKPTTSVYRGVCWDKTRHKWKATATVNYKVFHIGRFETEEDAAEAAREFRRQHMPFSTT